MKFSARAEFNTQVSNWKKFNNDSNCAFFYWSREQAMRLKHSKFQLTEKKVWTGQKMSHKFFREN